MSLIRSDETQQSLGDKVSLYLLVDFFECSGPNLEWRLADSSNEVITFLVAFGSGYKFVSLILEKWYKKIHQTQGSTLMVMLKTNNE